MFKLFGGRKKPAKAKTRKADSAPRTPPGEGIRQLAAVLPESDDPVTTRPAPKPQAAPPRTAEPASPPEPPAAQAPDPSARENLIREAMLIRRSKAKDLDDLPVRERKRLRLLAEKMMGVAPEPPTDTASNGKPSKSRSPSGSRN